MLMSRSDCSCYHRAITISHHDIVFLCRWGESVQRAGVPLEMFHSGGATENLGVATKTWRQRGGGSVDGMVQGPKRLAGEAFLNFILGQLLVGQETTQQFMGQVVLQSLDYYVHSHCTCPQFILFHFVYCTEIARQKKFYLILRTHSPIFLSTAKETRQKKEKAFSRNLHIRMCYIHIVVTALCSRGT